MEKPPVKNGWRAEHESSSLVAPHGIEEIVRVFGDIREHIGPDGKLAASWQMNYLARASLPFPLAAGLGSVADHHPDDLSSAYDFGFYRRLRHRFSERGLQTSVTSFGGCFAFRPQRTGYKLSAHSWGIAIDLNSESNPQGSAGNMDARVIDIFRSAGFEWGGEWKGNAATPCIFSFAPDIEAGCASLCAASNHL